MGTTAGKFFLPDQEKLLNFVISQEILERRERRGKCQCFDKKNVHILLRAKGLCFKKDNPCTEVFSSLYNGEQILSIRELP